MRLEPVKQDRPLFRTRCGHYDGQRRCYHDATVADLDGKPFAIESYYCDEHKPCAQCVNSKGVGPSHDPSPNCESGKRPHCTCDTCF